MLHIRPILEEKASEPVKEIYADIKTTLGVSIVPLVFQYIANFEDYLSYVWEKIKANIKTGQFDNLHNEVTQFSDAAMAEIYLPSPSTTRFIHQLPEEEKKHLSQTVHDLSLINSKLMLITIGIREGIKGVHINQELLQSVSGGIEEDFFDEFMSFNIMRQNLREQQEEIEPISKMLAPLFGSQAIAITQYPTFFSHVSSEMDELIKKETYLSKRVLLEQLSHASVSAFVYPLGSSYAEIAKFAGKHRYFGELLYILSETFPTRFPRLLLTTSVMKHTLSHNPHGLIV